MNSVARELVVLWEIGHYESFVDRLWEHRTSLTASMLESTPGHVRRSAYMFSPFDSEMGREEVPREGIPLPDAVFDRLYARFADLASSRD